MRGFARRRCSSSPSELIMALGREDKQALEIDAA